MKIRLTDPGRHPKQVKRSIGITNSRQAETKPLLPLPPTWEDIQPDTVYETIDGRLVCFGKKQIGMGKRYDPYSKHIKAIQNGTVPTDGHIGLVPSEEIDYDLKSKVLGGGGDYRFHGKYIKEVLHFPGVKTSH